MFVVPACPTALTKGITDPDEVKNEDGTQFSDDMAHLENNPLSRWHCALFVKQGLYQGGILKIQIEFPMNYPYARPRANFLNPHHIFHPLVHPKTGDINLDFDFPTW